MNYFKTDNSKRDTRTHVYAPLISVSRVGQISQEQETVFPLLSSRALAGGRKWQGLWESAPSCSWEHPKEGGPWCKFGARPWCWTRANSVGAPFPPSTGGRLRLALCNKYLWFAYKGGLLRAQHPTRKQTQWKHSLRTQICSWVGFISVSFWAQATVIKAGRVLRWSQAHRTTPRYLLILSQEPGEQKIRTR